MAADAATSEADVLVRLRDASLRFGTRVLWEHLELDVRAGEFLAVLGPNGAGKSSLLEVILGVMNLSSGGVEVDGAPARRGNHRVGYVPQQKAFARDLPIRGRDLVRFGVDGHRPGLPLHSNGVHRAVDRALAAVGATSYADAPIGTLSGGEQQRLRIAQALVGAPKLLLCDEPLLSLDIGHQDAVSRLIDEQRHERGCGVVFVTHDINPILDYVDRVLYLVDGRWAIGTPDDVMHGEQLSRLYGTHVEVLRVGGRLVVVGSHDTGIDHPHEHHHADHPDQAHDAPTRVRFRPRGRA